MRGSLRKVWEACPIQCLSSDDRWSILFLRTTLAYKNRMVQVLAISVVVAIVEAFFFEIHFLDDWIGGQIFVLHGLRHNAAFTGPIEQWWAPVVPFIAPYSSVERDWNSTTATAPRSAGGT